MHTILALVIYIAISTFCISNNVLFLKVLVFLFWFLANRRQDEWIQKQKGNPGAV